MPALQTSRWAPGAVSPSRCVSSRPSDKVQRPGQRWALTPTPQGSTGQEKCTGDRPPLPALFLGWALQQGHSGALQPSCKTNSSLKGSPVFSACKGALRGSPCCSSGISCNGQGVSTHGCCGSPECQHGESEPNPPKMLVGMQNLRYPQATLPYFSFHQDHITSELVPAEAPLAMPWGMSRQHP